MFQNIAIANNCLDTTDLISLTFILDRNLGKTNCTENQVCTSCDIVVLALYIVKDSSYTYI